MSTRSLTRVVDDGQHIMNMYRQSDGYPPGHGQELFDFLNQFTLVNGLGQNLPAKVANGAGCLAAQIVAHFKAGPGGIYLYPVSSTDCGQEYEYLVLVSPENKITINVSGHGDLFERTLAEFGEFCKNN